MDLGVKRKLETDSVSELGNGITSPSPSPSPSPQKKPATRDPMLITNILVRPDYEIGQVKAGMYRFVGCAEAPPTKKSTDVKNLETVSITIASTTSATTGITTPLMTLLFPERTSVFPDDIIPSIMLTRNTDAATTTTATATMHSFSDKTNVDAGILVHLVKSRNGGDKAVLKLHTKFPVFDAVRASSLCMRSYPYQYMVTTLLCGAFVSKPMLWLRIVLGDFYVKAVHAEYASQWWQCICVCPLVLTIPVVLPVAWFSCHEMRTVMVCNYKPSARVLAWIDTRHTAGIRRATTDADIAQWQAMIDAVRKRTTKTQSVFVYTLDLPDHDDATRACNANVRTHLGRIPFMAALGRPVELYDATRRAVVPATLFTSHRWTNHSLYTCITATSEWTVSDQPCVASYVHTSVFVKPHHADRQGAANAIRDIIEQSNPVFEAVVVVTTDMDAAVKYYYPVMRQTCRGLPILLAINDGTITRISSLDAHPHNVYTPMPDSDVSRTATLIVDNGHCISQTTIMRVIEWIADAQGMHMPVDRIVLMLDPLFLAGRANQWATDLMTASYHSVVAGWKTTDITSTILPGFSPTQPEYTSNGLAATLHQKVYVSAAASSEMPPLFTIGDTDTDTDTHHVFEAADASQVYTHLASLNTSAPASASTSAPKIYYVACADSDMLDPVGLRTAATATSTARTTTKTSNTQTCTLWHREVFAWSENTSSFAVNLGDVLAVNASDASRRHRDGEKYNNNNNNNRFIAKPVGTNTPATINTNAKKLLSADADGLGDNYNQQIAVVVMQLHVRAYKHQISRSDPVLSPDEFIGKLFTGTQPSPLGKFDKKDADNASFKYDMYLIEATVHDPVSGHTWQTVLYFKYSRAAAVATFESTLGRVGTWGSTATKLFTVYARKSMSWRNITVRDPAVVSNATLAPPTPTDIIIVVLGNKTLYTLASVWTAFHTATKAVIVVCTNRKTLESLYKPTSTPIPRIRSELGFPSLTSSSSSSSSSSEMTTEESVHPNDDIDDNIEIHDDAAGMHSIGS